MGLLNTLIYIIDDFGRSPYCAHFVCGAFFGFLFGLKSPKRAFYAALIIGFTKETIDFFKHITYTESFNFLTDPKYGLYDGLEDLLFWLIGGYITYRILSRFHKNLELKDSKAIEKSRYREIKIQPDLSQSQTITSALEEQSYALATITPEQSTKTLRPQRDQL